MRSLESNRSLGGFAAVPYGSAPSLLLLADSEAGFERGRRGAAAASLRIIAEAPAGDALQAIARPAAIDAIFTDIQDDQPLEALLPALNHAARRGSRGLIVASGRAAAALTRRCEPIRFVADPSGLDILEGLHAVAAPATLCFHDVKNADSPRLQQLSAEVGRIANILASLSEEEKAEESNGHGRPRVDAALVRAIIRARRLRDHYFRSELFADPAWDMLLDLYAARLDRQRVAVSSLCIAAAVPATTALRWIKSLTDQRLFVRIADPQDGRRVFIELSDEAAAGLEAYLVAAQRISPIIV